MAAHKFVSETVRYMRADIKKDFLFWPACHFMKSLVSASGHFCLSLPELRHHRWGRIRKRFQGTEETEFFFFFLAKS